MLTPDELQDLILEQAEKPNSYLTIERKSQNSGSETGTPKASKESNSSLISDDVHNISMEVVSTIRAGIIND